MWAVSTVTMLVLAGILPDFRLQSADGESATHIAVTAAFGAGAFGVLSALVWPLLVRLLLLVPALVLGLLVFVLNGSLLLVALRLNPASSAEAAPETAVVVAAVMSAVASATGAALAVRDDDAYRRRLYRLADRRRRRLPSGPSAPGTVSGAVSDATSSGSGSNERDCTSATGSGFSDDEPASAVASPIASVVATVAGISLLTAAGSATGAAAVGSAGLGLRSMR